MPAISGNHRRVGVVKPLLVLASGAAAADDSGNAGGTTVLPEAGSFTLYWDILEQQVDLHL